LLEFKLTTFEQQKQKRKTICFKGQHRSFMGISNQMLELKINTIKIPVLQTCFTREMLHNINYLQKLKIIIFDATKHHVFLCFWNSI